MRCLKLLVIVAIFVGVPSGVAAADEPSATAIAEELVGVIDEVLDNHISPPTRQEMLLHGCRAIFGEDDPRQLSRDISDLQDKQELIAFLVARIGKLDDPIAGQVKQQFIAGALTAIPGGARYSKAKAYAVEQQLRENRYVGIGIALAKQGAFPSMPQVIPGGPAHAAGGKNGDLMIRIDGEDATQYTLQQIIDLLRGQEGKPVSIVVRQPDSEEERTLDIVRGEVPFGSVEGKSRDSDDKWVYRAADDSDIAYLRLTAVRGSTARELKQAAQRLHAAGARALILDLQPTSQQGDLRHAVMIADELLGKATMGTAVTGDKSETFESSADQLFAGWPMVVLISPETQGQAEWIAAALQDNNRAVIVGQATHGFGFTERVIQLDNGDAISLRSGMLKRADGRSLVSHSQSPNSLQFGQRIRVQPAGAATRRKSQSGWHGIKPDVVVGQERLLQEAISILEQELKQAATE